MGRLVLDGRPVGFSGLDAVAQFRGEKRGCGVVGATRTIQKRRRI